VAVVAASEAAAAPAVDWNLWRGEAAGRTAATEAAAVTTATEEAAAEAAAAQQQ
jgi:hypothetical protein